jgi:hypothetical protein
MNQNRSDMEKMKLYTLGEIEDEMIGPMCKDTKIN